MNGPPLRGQGGAFGPTFGSGMNESAAWGFMPDMNDIGARDARLNRAIADCDPMGMGDIHRGAQALLSQLDGNPQGSAIEIATRVGIQNVDAFISVMRARCIAILSGPQGSFAMHDPVDDGMRFGMRNRGTAGVPYFSPRGSVLRTGGTMTGLGGEPYAAAGSRLGMQRASRPGPLNDTEDIGEEGRGSWWRRLFRRTRGNSLPRVQLVGTNHWGRQGPQEAEAGTRGGPSGSSMYGVFMGVGRI